MGTRLQGEAEVAVYGAWSRVDTYGLLFGRSPGGDKAKGIVVDFYPTYLNERFSQLTPEQNASYAARSEAARIKAWDEYDREMARQAAVRADLREK